MISKGVHIDLSEYICFGQFNDELRLHCFLKNPINRLNLSENNSIN